MPTARVGEPHSPHGGLLTHAMNDRLNHLTQSVRSANPVSQGSPQQGPYYAVLVTPLRLLPVRYAGRLGLQQL